MKLRSYVRKDKRRLQWQAAGIYLMQRERRTGDASGDAKDPTGCHCDGRVVSG
jgi:predicted lipoprotein with Yx(FWY)xxD motif